MRPSFAIRRTRADQPIGDATAAKAGGSPAPGSARPKVATVAETGTVRPWRRAFRDPWAVGGIVWLAVVVVLAVFVSLLAPYSPSYQDLQNTNAGPSATHLLGTDFLGRDLLSRLIAATRWSLVYGLLSMLVANLVAVPLGIFAGYVSGRLGSLVGKISDVIQSFPPLLILIAITGLSSSSVRMVVAVGVVFVPVLFRLVRATVIEVRAREYIDASRALGSSRWYIVRRRVLHNVVGPVLVQAPLLFGYAIVTEAGLAYLGLGPPSLTWGAMLSDAQSYIFTDMGALLWPGFMILLTVLAAIYVSRAVTRAFELGGGLAVASSAPVVVPDAAPAGEAR